MKTVFLDPKIISQPLACNPRQLSSLPFIAKLGLRFQGTQKGHTWHFEATEPIGMSMQEELASAGQVKVKSTCSHSYSWQNMTK